MWAVCFSGWWSWCAVTSIGQLAMCHQNWTVKALKLSCHWSASSTARMKQEVNQEWSTTNKPSSLLCWKQAQICCNLNPWEKVCYLPLRNIQLHMFYMFWWEIFVLYPLSSCSCCIETIIYCISVLTKSHDKQTYFNDKVSQITPKSSFGKQAMYQIDPLGNTEAKWAMVAFSSLLTYHPWCGLWFFLMLKFIYHCACTKYNVYRNNIDIIDKHTDPPHQANRSPIIQVTIVH